MEKVDKISESKVAQDLVARILQGDSQAEERMIQRYQRGLFAMLFNRCRDKALAEDVAQDTWILVLQKVRDNNLRDSRKLAAFIVQIGKNQLIMKYRAAARHPHEGEGEMQQMADETPSPEQQMHNTQLGEAIASAMSEMSQSRDRDLLRRFYLVGDDKSDLCKEYDLSEHHFDRVIYRVRERFKLLWQKQAVYFND